MKKYILLFLLPAVTLAGAQPLAAQESGRSLWSDYRVEADQAGDDYVAFRNLAADDQKIRTRLADAPMELTVDVALSPVTIEVPMPDGSTEVFHVVESPVMEQPLAERYPLIKTYAGQSLNGKLNARFDMGYQGFHAIVNTPKGAVYVDPVEGANDRYISYYAHEYQEHFMERESEYRCHMDHEVTGDEMPPALTAGKSSRDSGPILRTYALAVACTGEYSNAHGGTKPSVLSAITTTINRINEVYIREFAVRMNLIANNDALIFLNPGTDPYDNVNSGVMLQQNTGVINGIVGSGAYDFGHVFATGTSGGVAFLGSVCTGNKGAGVSGSTNTNGDPFAIDLVAHEIGHQFASPHTFNGTSGNCNSSNRSSATAWEPGSGTTIMAYAGICAPQNVQSFHDPYFHAGAHDRIMAFVSNSNGSVCATNTTTGNSIPEVDASASDGFTIPISTPFQLWGSGTDPDGEELDFMWEQMDLGPPGHPNFPTGNAPLFRSFRPEEEPTRIFPRLLNIVIGNQVLGEILPDYSRNMRFRLTARDNNLVSGGVGSDEISVAVSNAAGPFEVIAPSDGQVVGSGTVAMVTWDVANTDQAPVNSQWVNISLSIDNGFTYPDTLTMRTANDGSELVQFPNVSSTAARVRVQSDDNLFFNISPSNFTISPVGVGIVAPINLTLDPDFQSTVTLDWTDNSNNEDFFIIQKSVNGSGNFITIDSVPANVTTYDDVNVNFVTGQSDFYRVYAKNSTATSGFSNEASYFPVGVDELETRWNTAIYPNPSQGQFRLDVSAPETGTLVLEVMDLYGRTVRSETVFKTTEFMQYQLNLEGEASGVYYLRLRMDQQPVAVKQLIKY